MRPGRVSGVGSVRLAVADQRIGLAVDFEGVFLTDAAQVTYDVALQHLRRVDIGIAAELSDLRQFMGEVLRPLRAFSGPLRFRRAQFGYPRLKGQRARF